MSSATSGAMKVLLLEKNEVLNVAKSPYLPLVTYMHPKGVPVLYLSLADAIYELQMVQPKGRYASWFVDNRVSSDENFYIASKIDPKLLLLPYLEKNAKKFSLIDQIVTFDKDCHRLPVRNDKIKEWKLDLICDINDSWGDDELLCKYNEEKVMHWLTNKVQRAAEGLALQNKRKNEKDNKSFASHFNSSAQSTKTADSATSSSSALNRDITEGEAAEAQLTADIVDTEDRVMALQVVCDYLSEEMAARLAAHLGFSLACDVYPAKAMQPVKRKADWEEEMEIEKETLAFKMAPAGEAKAGAGASKKKVPVAAKATKAPVGVKSISSFFSAKK